VVLTKERVEEKGFQFVYLLILGDQDFFFVQKFRALTEWGLKQGNLLSVHTVILEYFNIID
jgi:hypothetical protein